MKAPLTAPLNRTSQPLRQAAQTQSLNHSDQPPNREAELQPEGSKLPVGLKKCRPRRVFVICVNSIW